MEAERKQVGGRLLGQGVYGCAFDPPLNCVVKSKSGKKKGHLIGKITSTRDAQKEWSISGLLQTLPNADQYYVLLEDYCVPAPRAEQKEPGLKDCKPLQKIQMSKTTQITMPYAGKPVFSIPKRQSSLDYFKLVQHLLEAGALLLTVSVVHGDIHTMNLLATSRSMVRIIDFGAGWLPSQVKLDNFQEIYRVFNPAIHQEPPEFSYINGLEDDLPENAVLAEIKTKKPALQLLQKLASLPVATQMKTFQRFLDTSVCYEAHDWLSAFKLYWSKVDSWGIGSTLLMLFSDMILDQAFFDSKEFTKKAPLLLDVLKGMLQMDPGLRLDCAEALEQWAPTSSVLTFPAVKEWLSKVKSIRETLETKL